MPLPHIADSLIAAFRKQINQRNVENNSFKICNPPFLSRSPLRAGGFLFFKLSNDNFIDIIYYHLLIVKKKIII